MPALATYESLPRLERYAYFMRCFAQMERDIVDHIDRTSHYDISHWAYLARYSAHYADRYGKPFTLND